MIHMDPLTIFWFAPVCAIIALMFAYIFYKEVMGYDEGNETMREIADHVREGAYAYLHQQYRVVGYFFAVAFVFLLYLAFVLHVQSKWVPFAFLTGGFFSALAGFIGMKTATNASARTAEGARHSLNRGLTVAFRAGSVMGLCVVGLALLYIATWFYILYLTDIPVMVFGEKLDLFEVTTTLLATGMGASAYALFARVGGGIYTKAADVGADLVGKVEVGIPEDDPRNPATIADNVGDNVGDVAGMGADLYESYAASILATATLGVAAGLGIHGVILPMAIAAVGILFSIVGIYIVSTKEDATQKELLHSLARGINSSSVLIIIGATVLVKLILVDATTPGGALADVKFGDIGAWGILGSIISGLLAGILIGKSSEYFTNSAYPPTQRIANQAETGPATVIITGISVGMESTSIPVLAVGLGTLLAFGLPGGFGDPALGLYGVSIAAVGMLSTLGITLATDAYGPIADNAGGNAEMSGLGKVIRDRTDALDSLGNTTAATGKGFAIGSAALTGLALLAAYIEAVRAGLLQIGLVTFPGTAIAIKTATLADFMTVYNVTLMNPAVLIGLVSGAMVSLLFCAMTIRAVGRAAGQMVNEVRRQFHEIEGIMEGETTPDYAACVRISTEAAQQEVMEPSLLALITPIVIGYVLGVPGVMGLLAGTLATGFAFAVFMANAGGAWDNAKKFIEAQENRYVALFNWDRIPGKDEGKLRDYLVGTMKLDWADDATIEKKDDDLIAITSGKESLEISIGAASSIEGIELGEGGQLEFVPRHDKKGLMIYVLDPEGEPLFDENGNPIRGKHSDMHKAVVVGDTVGDPLKDTSGPSLNILIKLMSMVSVVVAGFVVKNNIYQELSTTGIDLGFLILSFVIAFVLIIWDMPRYFFGIRGMLGSFRTVEKRIIIKKC